MTTDLKSHPDFVPSEVFEITDLETLKVLADPLRLRIRELMSEPCTVKQVAAVLDIPPTKLYYHINLLEKHNLIVVVDTRIVSGIIEKHYQVSARSVRVSRHLLSPNTDDTNEGITLTVGTLFDDTRANVIESVKAGVVDMDESSEAHRGLMLTSTRLLLNDEQARDLYSRLEVLMDEFVDISHQQQADRSPDMKLYKAFTALFPTIRKRRSDEEATEDAPGSDT